VKETMQVQLAWTIIEFLEKIADLILENYIDQANEADLMDDFCNEKPWAD
jgi:hypothetical protein